MPYDPSLYDRDRGSSDDAYVQLPYSTYAQATHGPDPVPDWVITDHNALDTELGVLKTGKEADVHLVRRALGDVESLLAAKRYRSTDHRLFHRDAGYQEGRRSRRSRDQRAVARGTGYGREVAAGTWAAAEFRALAELWGDGVPVPYPVQLLGTELLLEFVGEDDGTAAPRLAQCRPEPTELADLFDQCVQAMHGLARAGYAHGDLSAYNLLVHRGRLVLIDLPQVVDLVINPQGASYLERDCRNVCTWFAARGLDGPDLDHLFGDLMATAVARW
ncbi:RIO kinase 1 [Jatrophihabitans endophyticus]|uniref:non-specific serine/threonine protein kinase n=1 Tax=Jatrophihabitans endophyticus TaxID=1206085 RepID=A0A1M5MWJ7_9ACTN|nr:RIO1 family regulatory kinase/ATPase [Jatrophihabitans endophyticus]SHG81587.1 RIO kinase 1 [Jatrophihabitans endophyticus]